MGGKVRYVEMFAMQQVPITLPNTLFFYKQKTAYVVLRSLVGSDPNKDQSYFLCQLTQDQLSKAMFPIGDICKPEVRHLAHEADLPSAEKKDSQGICFVGKVDLPVFLQQKLKSVEGDVIEVYDAYFSESEQYKFIHDTLDSILADGSLGDVNLVTD